MCDNDPEYTEDPRIACKYGVNCYQKNPTHHKKYKHPQNKNKDHSGHVNKKIKIEDANKRPAEVTTSKDVSDSDECNGEEKREDSSSKTGEVNERVSDSESEENNGMSENVADKDQNEPDSQIIDNSSPDNSKNGDKGDKGSIESDTKEEKVTSGTLDYKQFIKEKFLVDMPDDFYKFWDYCKKLKPNSPLDALKDIGLKLVGPFDVLAGRFDNVNKSEEEYLLHWRYYHDPPELQTVLKGDDKTGYHIGYFRDSPDELPILLVSNSAKKDGILRQMGGNIFTAVNMYLDDLKKTGDPFKKMHIGRVQTSIKKAAESLKLDLTHRTDKMVSRERKIVTRTFNKIGLVVPYNRKTQLGYRELAMNNKDLADLLTKLQNALPEQRSKFLSELQPVFTYASIAADECDFGTGIELGWNIISHGVDCLNSTACTFLTSNYQLLNREAFAKIAEAHMSNRKKGCDLSII